MPPEKELTLEQRKALAMARARKRKAEAQKTTPSLDSNLRTVNVPDRIMGVKLPDFGPQTQVVSNAAEGYQIALPANAPEGVQRGIVQGAQQGTERRRRQANLATEGATALATNRFVAPTAGFVGDVANRFSGGRNKTLERFGAASAGAQDVGSFGFGDELGGLLHGEGAKLKQRQLTADSFKEHPISAMAGALPTMVIPGQTARGLTTLARAGSAAMRTALPAAVYGYGSGEGGALSADRAAKSTVYGGGGFVLGGGFQLGGRGLEFAGRKVLGSAELRSVASHLAGRGSSPSTIKLVDQAVTEVQRAARVDGQSIARDIAKQRLTDAVRRAEANDMLGDLVPGGVTSMEGSALPGMEGADLVVNKLRERGEGQYQRINQAVGRIVDGEDIQASLANLQTIKSEEAGPLYQAAFAPEKRIDVNHPRFAELNRLVQLDDFKKGVKAGQRIWRLENGDHAADFSRMNQFEQLDWIKKGLDAEIGKLLRSGDDATARAMINAKNRMLSIADDMNPDYARARQVWAGAESQREALLLGESLLTSSGKVKSGQALRDIQDQYAGYSEAEKTAFSIGLFERAVVASGDVIESGTANSAKRGFLSPNTQRELRNFLPEEQADEFLSLIEREYRQQMNANQALAGSPTGRRIKAGEAVRMATGGARAAAAELSDPQGLIRKGQEAIRNTIGNNPRVQRGFAEFLTRDASDPALRRALGVDQPPRGLSGPGPQNALAPSVGAPQAAPVAQNSLPMLNNPTVGGAVAGGMAGGSMAQDLDGDGRVSMQERYVQGSLGALTGGLGGRAIGKLDNRMISKGSQQVLEGSSAPKRPLPTPDELAAAESEVIRTSQELEPLQRAWGGPGVSNADDRRILDAATQKNQRALANYYDMRDRLEAASRSSSDGGVDTMGIGGRTRKDVMKDVMSESQGSRVPGVSSPSRRADGPSAQSIPPAPVGDGGDGLGLLMGGAAALGGGVAVTNALAGGNPQAQGSGGANAFASRIANSAQSGMNRMQQGLPFPPSVKPDLSRNMDQMNQAAYLQNKDEMQALYESLPQGERLAWNQLREEMAEELKVKPEEAQAGIIHKRLLPNGELQVLIEGQWKTLEFVQ